MRRAAAAVLPLAAALALTGCVPNSDDTPAPSIAASKTASSAASTAPSMDVSASDAPHDDATVVPVPEAGPDSQADAIAAAEKVVTVFGQPTLDAQTWINNLYPLMTQAGAAAYEGTDPARVPVRSVTGPGVILDGSTDVALIVQVPTDAGLYNVSLSRPSVSAAWLADRIRPAGA